MKRARAMRLPWLGRNVPHAILDVGRGCDVTCPDCYNSRHGGFRSLNQLESDFSALRQHRRLQTVSLTGGEPVLHPEIVQVVGMISRAGIKPALLTNGLRLTPKLLEHLGQAGLSAVLLHIQPPQQRADIDAAAAPSEWRRLRAEKARLLCAHGIKAGLSWIAYRSRLDELADAMEEVLDSAYLDYLLVTACRDFDRFADVEGSVETGFQVASGDIHWNAIQHDEMSLEDLRPLTERLDLPPFGKVGSSRDAQKPRWLTHLVAVTHAPDGRKFRAGIRPGLSDWLFSRMLRLLTGRHAFLFTPPRWQFQIQLACNALTGGRFVDNWRALRRSFAGHRLVDKHILLQEGPTLLPDGEIEFCDNCPDAVWRDNALVPVCLADRMVPAQPKTPPW